MVCSHQFGDRCEKSGRNPKCIGNEGCPDFSEFVAKWGYDREDIERVAYEKSAIRKLRREEKLKRGPRL
jgi:hypothetical protein